MVIDPAKFRKRAGAALMWAALLGIAAAPRAAAMLTVCRRLDADESIVGLMAKHIAAGERIPIFFYGQDYGGGHVIEALLATPLFKLFGPSEWAVHLIPVLFSIAIAALVFVYLRRIYGGRTSFAAASLASLSVQFLRSSLKADGYIETVFLGVLALLLLQRFGMAYREAARRRLVWLAAAMGAALGLGMWSYDFAAVYAVAVFVVALRRGLLHPARIGAFIGGFLAGAAPLIHANLSQNYAHLKHFAEAGPGGPQSPVTAADKFTGLFTRELPAFLTPDCIHNFVLPVPWYAWCTAALLLISVIALAAGRRKTPGAPALVFLLTLAAYIFSGYGGRSPRYLLPLEPYLSASPAIAIAMLYGVRRHSANLLAAAMIALLAAGLVAGNIALFHDNTIVEGGVKTDPESLVEVARFLEKNHVECIETTYFIKWRILFLTNERVNASDIKAYERERAYLRYEEKGCPEGALPGYVFHKASPYRFKFAAEMNRSGLPFKIFYAHDHIAAIPLPQKEPSPISN
jgi:4-amino-4-deoxy-L-arabinose transferase-like glycosyltransferase